MNIILFLLSFCSKAGLLLCQLFAQSPSSVTVELGGSVTLSCSVSKSYSSNALVWIKQPSGGPSTSIVSFKNNAALFHGGFDNNKRCAIDRSGDSFNLNISNIEASDVARYYCGAIRDTTVRFGSGTSIRLKGSGSVSRRVEQQPASVPVQPGDSVTLQCTIHTETCAGEHSVHWFRHGSGEALPGLIYTHGNRSDPCESSSEPGLPAQGCVYELPKRNLRSSDAGTYYCAVATCGQILFGNGTRLEFAGDRSEAGGSAEGPCGCGGHSALSLSVLALAAVLCVFGTLVTALLCRRRRAGTGPQGAEAASGRPPHSDQHCSPAHGTDTESQQRGERDVLAYAAVDFDQNKRKAGKKRREGRSGSELASEYAAVRTQRR